MPQRYICQQCGSPFMRKPQSSYKYPVRFCSYLCDREYKVGVNNPRWKGGTINKDGYRMIHVKGKQYREHRIVMEQHLGRKLKPEENIHHKDGNKLNNSLDNLEVMMVDDHARYHASLKEKRCCILCSDVHVARGFCNRHYKQEITAKSLQLSH